MLAVRAIFDPVHQSCKNGGETLCPTYDHFAGKCHSLRCQIVRLSPEVARLTWVARYPDLFAELDDRGAQVTNDALNLQLERGLHPTRDDVEDLCATAAGHISFLDYLQRVQSRHEGCDAAG